MNPPQHGRSKTRLILWCLLGVFLLTSAGLGVFLITQWKRLGLPTLAAAFHPITPIDLMPYYDESASWNGVSAWEVVPHGKAVLGGVPFEVNGVLRLTGIGVDKNSTKPYRDKVDGIIINKKFARLHLLHLASHSAEADTPYARLVLHYEDGSTSSFQLQFGRHARDWHRPKFEYPSALSDPNSKVVWRGTHESTDRTGKTLRLFKTTFENPKPDQMVTSIDALSEHANPNAVILAMSIGPSNLPRAKDDPASLPEPEEPYEGELHFTAVNAETGEPVPNVKLKVSGTEASGSFRTPDVVTDARGQCVVRHPGESVSTLSISTFGDGVPEKTIRWQLRAGNQIPSEYTHRVTKAVTIGGTVQDETGQPISGAKIAISQYLSAQPAAASLERIALGLTAATTDARGHWEFRSLPEGFRQFALAVSHPQYPDVRFLSDGVDRNYVGERVAFASLIETNASLQLRKGLAVNGRVVSEEGEPISGAKLLLGDSRFSSNPNRSISNERGEFHMTAANAGPTYLTVQAGGYTPAMQQIDVSTNTKPVEFKLAPGRDFKARVVDESGTPVRSARITIDMWQNRQTLDLNGTTDSRGNVTIKSMPPDSMSGSIYKSGYKSTSGLQFHVSDEVQTFTLRRGATLTGTVLDAETKQPVERFDITRGQNSGGSQIYWQSYNTVRGTNGEFSLKLDQENITALKIEADDHLPVIVSLDTNDVTHFDIEMKKGSGPKGIVHGPDGKPVAGAQLAVVSPGRSLNMGAGKFTNGSRNESGIAETDPNGAFSLRAQADGEKIIAVHPSGYAEASFSNFVNGSTIALQAWGTIEGVLNIGNQPGTNQSLLLTPGLNTGPSSFWYEFQAYKVTTDAQGRFVISNAPPGERIVVRLIQTDERSWMHSQPRNVLVKPGEVTHLTIGGDGHLVIGQLSLSDPGISLNWRNSGYHSLSSYPKPPPFKTREEFQAWNELPETIEARKKARSYPLQMNDTGAFRIEDVLPGSYDLNISLSQRNGQMNGAGQFIGSLTTNLIVPAFIKGPNVPPIDLGTLQVTVRPNYNSTARPTTRAAANK